MSSRTVVLAPPTAAARAVLDLLRDWSALGWIEDFLWAEADDHVSPGIPADAVHLGQRRRGRLMDLLTSGEELSSVHLTVLTCLGEQDDRTVPREVAEAVRNLLRAGPAGQETPTHCIGARHGRGAWQPGVAWPSWRSVLLAPEDAWAPTTGAAPFEYDPLARIDPSEEIRYSAHVAGGLASLAALWTGVDGGDAVGADVGTGVAGQSDLVLARSFVRRLDASAVEAVMRTQLMDLTLGVPLPAGLPRSFRSAQEIAPVTRPAIRQLQAKHAHLFRSTVLPTTGPPAGWPDDRQAAGIVDEILKGHPDAAYLGETAGFAVTGQAVPDLSRLGTGARQLAIELSRRFEVGEIGTESLRTDHFWQDVVRVGFALIDGRHAVEDIDQPRAVVPAPRWVAPAVGALGQFALPPTVGTATGRRALSPSDVILQNQMRRRLDRLVRSGAHRGEAENTLRRLREWTKQLEDVYLYRVGHGIAATTDDSLERIDQALQRIRELGRRMAPPAAPAVLPAPSRPRRPRPPAALVAVLALALLTALGWLWHDGRLAPAAAGSAMLLVAVAAVAALILRRRRRVLPTPPAGMIEAVPIADIDMYRAVGELLAASTDLQRMLLMYRQYVMWADVLGAFLAHPYGRQASLARERRRLSGPLPKSIRVARLEPDGGKVAEACRFLHEKIHTVGWLWPLWERAVDSGLHDAARALKMPDLQLDDLWGDEAGPVQSPLRELARQWVSDGVDPASGDQEWRRAARFLGDSNGWGELGTIEELAHPDHPAPAHADQAKTFIETLRSQAARPAVFDRSVLTGPAMVEGTNEVSSCFVMPSESAPAEGTLDRVQVVVQFSKPVAAALVCLRDRDGRVVVPPPTGWSGQADLRDGENSLGRPPDAQIDI